MIDKLHFISNQRPTHLDSIRVALEAGCRWIQLRIKNEPEESVLVQAIAAKKLCDAYSAKLIINDFPKIAYAIGAYGVHLGLEDLSIGEARKIVGQNIVIGATANTVDHIKQHVAAGADYIGLGPFRFTTTKQNLGPILGLGGFEDIMKQVNFFDKTLKIIAIGGLRLSDIPDLSRIGIHGVAMSSALMLAENREEMVAKIYKTLC